MRKILPLLLVIVLAAIIAVRFFVLTPDATDEVASSDTGAEGVAAPEEEDAGATMTMDEATAGPSNVALWKVGDEDTTVYMMGTVHILHPGIEWEHDTFETAWAESTTAFFEADILSTEAAQEAAPVMIAQSNFTDGRKLADMFTEEEVAKIDAGLKQFNLSVRTLGNVRPWLVNLQLAQLAMQKIGGDPQAGIDMILLGRANEEGKELRYFETMAEQIQIIAGMPDEVWAQSLVDSIGDFANIEGYFAQMVSLWYRGDADGLAAFLNETWDAVPEMKGPFIDQRNEHWAAVLDELIREEPGTFFVAVGAAHLAGENSVQDYLLEYGHESVRLYSVQD